MRGRMRGMGGGLGGLQQTTGLWQDWKRIFNRTGNENLANQWVESQQVAMADGPNWDSMPDLADWKQGIKYPQPKPIEIDPPDILGEQWAEVAYNVGDVHPYGGLGRKTGYGSGSGRDYGPSYEELETIPLDMQFDQWGNPIGGDDYGYFDDTFAARGGLMSLRR
jgi:hypothetical protein